ncbi:Proline dehydrogenase, mitochondrial [Wickerhamomyces ciferrii]|uniref:Proline dehydrogenase n=1 Tax=Wickerhamomyces ciferrii (strain ATCC 14091 / BCRC 22168 / CBS 111 / JCM 3599 / NBRC 0793 / NRRL Y-1031 F-60-10) TaxID=1206466 RepID=K0KKQ2_WICCF|nr:Proline dehydrogenase, mitochondrial [Wickerhamomyces ciferrii]CCH41698.1 Proline dehydrogenase, mitochondrial [Wickerhamomyces ciferrii]
MFRSRLPLPRSRLIRFINTSQSNKSTTTTTPSTINTVNKSSQNDYTILPNKQTLNPQKTYLDSLSNKMLFSYGAIGLCTLNKPILNLVIKLFPIIPTPILDFFIGKLYVGGSTPSEVIKTGEELSKRGINNMMLSLTIEDSEGTKNIDINYIVEETMNSIETILKPQILRVLTQEPNINEIPPGYIVIKPSALISNPAQVLLNFEKPEWSEQFQQLNKNCEIITEEVVRLNNELSKLYPERKSPFFVTVIDAEKFDLQQGVYKLQRNLFQKFNKPSGFVNVVGTIQMYLKQSFPQIKLEESLAQAGNYRVGLKLVRGAYIHSESDRSVIHDTKLDTDQCYDQGIKYVLSDLEKNQSSATLGHLVVASHNSKSSHIACDLLSQSKSDIVKSNVVLGQLLGMCDDVTFNLIQNHKVKNIIKYVPWGPPVETKDYLLRRLQENGDAVREDNGWKLVKQVARVFKNRLF